jgi:adenine-specific DNA-methyltransferase
VLIHSENFQALGLIQQKYRDQVKCIYIDPPYNKGNDFAYKDSYRHSSWISAAFDRLLLSKGVMAIDTIQWVSLDENEAENFNRMLKEASVFKESKLITAITNLKGTYDADGFVATHEYVICCTTKSLKTIGELPVPEENLENDWSEDQYGLYKQGDGLRRTGADAPRSRRPNGWFPVFINEELRVYVTENDIPKSVDHIAVYPLDSNGSELSWSWSKKKITDEWYNLTVKGNEESGYSFYKKQRAGLAGVPTRKAKSFFYKPEYSSTHGGNAAKDLFGYRMSEFTPKSVSLISDLILLSNCEGKVILDYYAGTGTTAHSVINVSRHRTQENRSKFILIEAGDYFYEVLKPRIQKVVYSKDWKDGKPISREGISHCFKTLRLESYEDTLNNLTLKTDAHRDSALASNPDLQRDYLLNYFIDVETQTSQSLLNIADFRDPTAYKMSIKKPGSEEQSLQAIDLIETFNWLIGLWVSNIAAAHSFSAEFEREQDPDLPNDQKTRLICKRLKVDDKGDYWFRLIEGYTLKVPGDETSKVATLIIWRKQTTDAEKDNVVLQKFLMDKLGISPRAQTYDVIYINGSHTLPNPVIEGEKTKVRLIEEAFHNAMWSGE